MKYNVLRSCKCGDSYEVLYELLNDDGTLVVGGLTTCFNSLPTQEEIDTRMADLISDHIERSNEVAPVFNEVSDVELDMLESKRSVKSAAISQIKAQTAPTVDSIVASLPEYDSDFVRYLVNVYVKESYEKGYIKEETFDDFSAFLKSIPVETIARLK